MRLIAFILLLIFVPTSFIWGQKNRKKSEKKQETEEVTLLSSRDFGYIDNFHKGVHEKISGNYTEALQYFKKCLVERQDDDAVYFAVAEIYKKQSNVSEALKYYEKAYELDPDNSVYLEEFAYTNFDKSNFEIAENLFQKMCDKEPRNIDYRYGLIKILIYNKSYKKAIEQIEKLEEMVGIMPELSGMKADLYLEQKNPKKAEETMLQLKNEFPDEIEVLQDVVDFYQQQGKEAQALEILEELAEKNPEQGIVYYVLAENYLENKDIEKFVQIAPHIFEYNDVEVGYKLLVFEQLAKIKGNTDAEVMKITEKMYHDYPHNDYTALNYSNTLVAKKQSKKALEIFRKTIRNNPDNFEAWGSVLSFESRYFEYENLYNDGKEAIELFPMMPYPYYAASEGALKIGKLDEALEIVVAGEIYALDDKKQQALFDMRKGQILFTHKDYKKGIVEFEKALNKDKSALVKINYAMALIEANIATDVSKELLGSIDEEDRNEKYYRAAASWQVNKNNISKAIQIAEEGMAVVFNNAELCDLLGDLYFRNNNSVKALEIWKKAMELESRNQSIPLKIKSEKYHDPKYN